MLLSDLITSAAERFPHKTALVFGDQSATFGELHTNSSRVAAHLRRLGIGCGARVAIVHENSIDAVTLFWGVLNSGAQVVDVPCLAGVATISGILAESKPAALVASRRQLLRLVAANVDLPRVVLTTGSTAALPGHNCYSLDEISATEFAGELPRPSVNDTDVALIIYTSGSTGVPKGVMLSHRNLLSNVRSVNSLMRLTSDDSILLVVPLHFIHGRMQLLTHTLVGGTIAFSVGFQFPRQVVNELLNYRVTGFSGVPYHFSALLNLANLSTTSLPDLRYAVVTGGALSPHSLRRLAQALPHAAIHIGYGQTEASPRITNLDPTVVLSKPHSSGKAIPGVRVEIVADDGSPVPAGEIGEVAVSGPNVMCGYVSGDEITSNKIDEFGRLRTGDLGRFDADGYLYLVGRKSELIKSAGERVFPREIEAVIDFHPAVRECAVFGLPDELLGERIVACVVTHPGSTTDYEDLRTHCLKALPVVRLPREVRFSDSLPKTGSGKIDRAQLPVHFHELGIAHRRAA